MGPARSRLFCRALQNPLDFGRTSADALGMDTTRTQLQAINVKLCPEAVIALRSLAARHGTTMTGLVDALAHRAGDLEKTPEFQSIVKDAWQIDAERRKR